MKKNTKKENDIFYRIRGTRAFFTALIALAIVICQAIGPVIRESACKQMQVMAADFTQTSTKFTYVGRDGDNVTLKWDKVTGADGYQIYISDTKKFTSYRKKNISGNTSLSVTLKGLAQSEVFYKVRAYKTGNDKKKIFSAWSAKARTVGWNPNAEFAGFSKIHTGYATIYYTYAADKKKKTVCINAGHGTSGGSSVYTQCHPDGSAKVTGGSTASGSKTATAVSGGTTFLDGTSEASVNLALAIKVKDALLKEGYNVLMIRETSDVQLDNIARTVTANRFADCHIALHYDSTTSDKGAFYIGVPDVASYRSMYPVSKHYMDHALLGQTLVGGMKDSGVKIYGSGTMAIDLTQTSYSKIPSVDLEVGDRNSDHSDAALDRLAKGIVAGLDAYFK